VNVHTKQTRGYVRKCELNRTFISFQSRYVGFA